MNLQEKLRIPGLFRLDVAPKDQQIRLCALRPYVRQSGDSQRTAWLMEERRLLDYLVVHIIDGKGRFSVSGDIFDVGQGDTIWIPPDTLHEMSGFPPKMHCLYVHFDLLYNPARSHWDMSIPGGMHELGDFRALMHPPLKDPLIDDWKGKLLLANSSSVKGILQKICLEHSRSDNPSMSLILSGLMLELIAEIIRGHSSPSSLLPHHWDKMQRALRSVQDASDAEFSVEKAARAAGFSASHFRKLFREVHGESVRSARRRANFQKAREWLLYSDLPVKDIAGRCGFSSVHNFSRAFREQSGFPPCRFRQGEWKVKSTA